MFYGGSPAENSRRALKALQEWGYQEILWIRCLNPVLMQYDLRQAFHITMDRRTEQKELRTYMNAAGCCNGTAVVFDDVTDLYLLEQILALDSPAQIVVITSLFPPRLGDVYIPLETPGGPTATPDVRLLYGALEQNARRGSQEDAVALEALRYCSLLCGDCLCPGILGQLLGCGDVRETLRILERMGFVERKGARKYAAMEPEIQDIVRSCIGRVQVLSYKRRILDAAEGVYARLYLEPLEINEKTEWRIQIEHLFREETKSEGDVLFLKPRLGVLAGKYDYIFGEYADAECRLRWVKEHALDSGAGRVRREAVVELARVLEAENDNEGVKNEIAWMQREFPEMAREYPALWADALLLESQAEENRGSYRRTNLLLREGMELLRKSPDMPAETVDEKKALLLNGLGKVYAARHRFRKAIRVYDKAIAVSGVSGGLKEAFIYANKGEALYYMKRYLDAEACLLKQKEIYESFYGDGLTTVDRLNNLQTLIALCIRIDGREDNIEEYWALSKKLRKEGGQKYVIDELYLYNSYGCYHYGRGNYEKSECIFSEGIGLCERIRDSDNTRIWIQMLLNRARAYCQGGCPGLAAADLKIALSKCKEAGTDRLRFYWQYNVIRLQGILRQFKEDGDYEN